MTPDLPVPSIAQTLLARTAGGTALALPFRRDIFLLETHVAGLQYYDARKVLPTLAAGANLRLRREPSNPHDGLAIEVFLLSGEKLGYVPRHRNPVLARLMDAGKMLLAEICQVRHPDFSRFRWDHCEDDVLHEIRFRISMREE